MHSNICSYKPQYTQPRFCHIYTPRGRAFQIDRGGCFHVDLKGNRGGCVDLKGKVEGCVDLSVTGEGWSFAHLGGWRWGGVAVPPLPFTHPCWFTHPLPRLHACRLQASGADVARASVARGSGSALAAAARAIGLMPCQEAPGP